MNDAAAVLPSDLSIACPRCGDVQHDDYEVIDEAVATDWRCAACDRVFSVLLTECAHCTADIVSVALTASEQIGAADVVCPRCHKPGCRNEQFDAEELFP